MSIPPMTRLGGLATALARRLAPRSTTLPAREAYALWADSYPPRPHNPLMRAEQAVVAPIIRSTSPARALDVGTGSGRYLPLLAATGARLVVGVDFSLAMLTRERGSRVGLPRFARARLGRGPGPLGPGFCGGSRRTRPTNHREEQTALVCGDARRLPFADASFDLVSAALMVGDVADLGGWVAEMARVLAPDGHLIYSDFHPSWATEGWRRTFRTATGQVVELAYFAHTIDEHLTRLEEGRFDVRQIFEQRPLAEDGGGATGGDPPVVVVFHAVKRPSARRG